MEKWKGSFAQEQLEKFGWESGKGLGKHNDGNAKHINVTVKNDKKGVGVNKGDWEFAWWDHLYNKSADSVVVAKEEGEIKVATKKKGETRRSKTGIISTQKPTGLSVKKEESSMSSVADAQNMMDSVKEVHNNMAQRLASASLYGAFVKSASTSAAPTPGTSDKEQDDDEELKDYSIKITDAELFAACEGRTARKGGRGLVDQTGKFKRVMKEYVRPKDDDDEITVQKRKRSDEDDKKASKKQKKADKETKKADKKARKAEKEARKAEKQAKKAEKLAKKAEKEARKAKKQAKKEAKKK